MKTSDPLGGFRFAELYLLLKQLFNAHSQDLSDAIQFYIRNSPLVVFNPGYRASADIDRHSFQPVGEGLLTELLFVRYILILPPTIFMAAPSMILAIKYASILS